MLRPETVALCDVICCDPFYLHVGFAIIRVYKNMNLQIGPTTPIHTPWTCHIDLKLGEWRMFLGEGEERVVVLFWVQGTRIKVVITP